MPLKRKENAKDDTPELGNDLSGKQSFRVIASLVEMPPATVRDILVVRGKLDGKKGATVWEAIPIIVRYYREMAESTVNAEREDKARITKANADEAELDLGRKLETLVPRAKMEQLVLSGITIAREKIRRLPGLTLEQKQAVCDVIAGVTVEDLEDHE